MTAEGVFESSDRVSSSENSLGSKTSEMGSLPLAVRSWISSRVMDWMSSYSSSGSGLLRLEAKLVITVVGEGVKGRVMGEGDAWSGNVTSGVVAVVGLVV